MENPHYDQIVILRVRNLCCIPLRKELHKELSKLDGVEYIAINPEKSTVAIIGKVDADLIVNTIAKTGKHAEILHIRNNTTNNNENQNHAEEFRHYENAHKKHRNEYTSSSRSKQHEKYRCQENNGHKMKEEDEEKEHKCEDYVPPPIDERVCRDFYCKSHRSRPIFRGTMPGSGGYGYFGHFPYHGRMRGNPCHQPSPLWFGEEMPRPSAYAFPSGRPIPGYDGYGFYGDESGRGCTTM